MTFRPVCRRRPCCAFNLKTLCVCYFNLMAHHGSLKISVSVGIHSIHLLGEFVSLDDASVDGYFYALDARNGTPLWQIALGGPVHASPMTYAVNNQQFVTMTIGNVVYTFGLEE